MGLWQGIFLVIGCALAGLIVGLTIMYVLQKKKIKRYSIFQEKKNQAKPGVPGSSVATAANNTIIKSNGHEDPLEELIKNRKNNVVAESPKEVVPDELPVVPQFAGQPSAPVKAQGEKPAEAKAINWTELILPHNEPVAPKEAVTANLKNTMVADEPKQAAPAGSFKSPEISSRKTISVGEAPKKTTKSTASKKQEAVITRTNPAVKEAKKSVKPFVQIAHEPEIIRQESAPAVEEYAEPPKHSVLEPEIFMSESIAAAAKSAEPPETRTWEPEPVREEVIAPVEKHSSAAKSDFMQELEYNLDIAAKQRLDKLTSFQTKCWDTSHGEYEPLLTDHHQELIQLYVDIGLANNIVWLATEIGHRSSELDDSYLKLCNGIAESIRRIAPSLDNNG